jgi:hypothetical protein
MPEIKQRYKAGSIEDLFSLEEELIMRVLDYCLRTNKEIETTYSVSTGSALIFILEIKITQA